MTQKGLEKLNSARYMIANTNFVYCTITRAIMGLWLLTINTVPS